MLERRYSSNTFLILIAWKYTLITQFSLHLTGPDATFRIRMAAMKDIYDVLVRVGKSLRDLQLLPWERQAMLKDTTKELELMVYTLQNVQGSAAPKKDSAARSKGFPARSKGSAAGSKGSMAPSKGSVARGKGSMTPSKGTAAGSKGSTACSKGSVARSKGSVAGSKGSAARSKGAAARSKDPAAASECFTQARLRARWPALAEHTSSMTAEQVNGNISLCPLSVIC